MAKICFITAIYGNYETSYSVMAVKYDGTIYTPEQGLKGEALLEEDVTVNPTSKVGGGSFLARGSSVGAECEISGTIVGEEAVIEDHVILKNSYIAPFSRVKSGSRIEGQVFGF